MHSSHSSQSLRSPASVNISEQSQTIITEILTYPWTNETNNASVDTTETTRTSSVVHDQFQADFYYLCPLKNTTHLLNSTDDKANGIHKQLSHDV